MSRELNILWMYPDILNLHGERASVQAFQKVAENLGIKIITEQEFNVISISELIELGHKVTDISFYAYVNNSWQLLFNNKVIGYKLCRHFDTVKTNKVKIKVNESLDTPVLHSFGIYKFDESLFESDETVQQHKKVDDFLGNYVAICGSSSIFRLETFLAEGKPIKKST